MPDYVAYAAALESGHLPCTTEEAMAECAETMVEEIKALKKNQTWEEVDKPQEANILTVRCVYQIKQGEGCKPRYKARMVARGCPQRQGIDYEETFSPVVKYDTIRYLFALAVKLDLKIIQLDIVTAYLNSEINGNVYVRPPIGMSKPGKVWKLKKAMYGLKQSGRAWNNKIDSVLVRYGLRRSKAHPCAYVKRKGGNVLIAAIYVDDILILSNRDEEANRLKAILNKKFEVRDLGRIKQFLGFCVNQNFKDGEISVNQTKYIEATLLKFGMQDCKTASTPADPNAHLSSEVEDAIEEERDDKIQGPYKEAVGSLLYISQISRPDIAYAVNAVSSYSENPKKKHWTAVKRIFRYLKATKDKCLHFKKDKDNQVVGYSDADWGNDLRDRKSITGGVFKLCGGAVSWYSRKQRTVALSTVEAEYISLSFANQEAMWFGALVGEIEGLKKRV